MLLDFAFLSESGLASHIPIQYVTCQEEVGCLNSKLIFETFLIYHLSLFSASAYVVKAVAVFGFDLFNYFTCSIGSHFFHDTFLLLVSHH